MAALELVSGSEITVPPKIPTGIFGLDLVLGRGSNKLAGIPIGRYTLIYGPEGSMKTTLVLRILGNAQKMCFNCYNELSKCSCGSDRRSPEIIFFDFEQAWTKEWAEANGCDPSKVKICRPANIDDFVNDMLEAIRIADIIVIETIAKICRDDSADEIADDRGAYGETARKLSDADNRWLAEINKKKKETGRYTTIIMENQTRAAMNTGGPPAAYLPLEKKENLPGGNWQKFSASTTIRMESSFKAEKDDDNMVEAMIYKFKINKNKVFLSRGYEGSFLMAMANSREQGIKIGDIIQQEATVIDYAIAAGLMTQEGKSTIKYLNCNYLGEVYEDGETISKPHKPAMIKFLQDNPKIYERIKNDVIEWFESRHSVLTPKDSEEV